MLKEGKVSRENKKDDRVASESHGTVLNRFQVSITVQQEVILNQLWGLIILIYLFCVSQQFLATGRST
jgi:hypothetical protein